METATLIVERASDGGFWAYPEEEFDGWSFSGFGKTAKEAVEDAVAGYHETRVALVESGKDVPDLKFTNKYDIQSFFDYFSFLNISKVGEMAGINPSLMRQYASGLAKASQKQYDKIRKAVSHIAEELTVAEF